MGALVAGDTDADVAGGADSGGAGFGAGIAFGTTELGAVELAGGLETIGAAGPAVRDVAVDDGLADGAWLLAGADVPRTSERASRLRAKTTAATPANVTHSANRVKDGPEALVNLGIERSLSRGSRCSPVYCAARVRSP